jgi:hypothetical protein
MTRESLAPHGSWATHHLRAPAIDVVKTRIQIDPALKGNSLLTAGRKIVAAEGTKGLLTGFGPTAVGYFFQGGAKFAGYEASVSDSHGSSLWLADW